MTDVGPEFVSAEFAEWAEQRGFQLHREPVEAPWQNGLAERAGGTLKWILAKLNAQSSGTPSSEMETLLALAIATKATNCDINASGYSASQWVLGRQPVISADILNRPPLGRLPEHLRAGDSAVFVHRLAMLETAKAALVRLHFSRRLRRAELARARIASSLMRGVGDLCSFYREQLATPRGSSAGTGSCFDNGTGRGSSWPREGAWPSALATEGAARSAPQRPCDQPR